MEPRALPAEGRDDVLAHEGGGLPTVGSAVDFEDDWTVHVQPRPCAPKHFTVGARPLTFQDFGRRAARAGQSSKR